MPVQENNVKTEAEILAAVADLRWFCEQAEGSPLSAVTAKGLYSALLWVTGSSAEPRIVEKVEHALDQIRSARVRGDREGTA